MAKSMTCPNCGAAVTIATPPPACTRDALLARGLLRRVPELDDDEREVLELLIQGKTRREVARRVNRSTRGVDEIIARVLDRLGAHNTVEAAAYLAARAVTIGEKGEVANKAAG